MLEVYAVFGIYIAICGWIWAMFSKLGSIARKEFLNSASEEIIRFKFSEKIDKLSYLMVKAVDAVFDFRRWYDTLEIPSIRKSLIATITLSLAYYPFVVYIDYLDRESSGARYIISLTTMIVALPFNVFADFISFTKSRFLISIAIPHGFILKLIIVIFDTLIAFILSIIIGLLSFIVMFFVTDLLDYIYYSLFLRGKIKYSPYHLIGEIGIDPIWVIIISMIYSFLTNILITTLYVIFQLAMPMIIYTFRYLDKSISYLSLVIDVKEKPMEFIAISLITFLTFLFMFIILVIFIAQ